MFRCCSYNATQSGSNYSWEEAFEFRSVCWEDESSELVLASPVGRGPRSHCLLRIPVRLHWAQRGRGTGVPPATVAGRANGQAVGAGQNPRWRGQPNRDDPWGWGAGGTPILSAIGGRELPSAMPPLLPPTPLSAPPQPSPTHIPPAPGASAGLTFQAVSAWWCSFSVTFFICIVHVSSVQEGGGGLGLTLCFCVVILSEEGAKVCSIQVMARSTPLTEAVWLVRYPCKYLFGTVLLPYHILFRISSSLPVFIYYALTHGIHTGLVHPWQ